MATYQKWSDSYTNKVTTIKLTYRGVKYNPNKISRDNQKSSSNFGVYRGVKFAL